MSFANGRDSMLARGLALLEAFGTIDSELTLSELSRHVGLPKPTVHRLVTELVAWGGLERTGRRLRLGRRLATLGCMAPRERQLRDAAAPYLSQLAESARQCVHLGVLDSVSPAVLVLTRLVPKRAALPCPPVLPVHATALGRALLAFGPDDQIRRVLGNGLARHTTRTVTAPAALLAELARVRHTRLAVCAGETITGVTGVAVPVLAAHGEAVAALAISGRSGHLDVRRVIPQLAEVGEELSAELTHWSDASGYERCG